MSEVCLGPEAAKQNPNHDAASTMPHSEDKVLFLSSQALSCKLHDSLGLLTTVPYRKEIKPSMSHHTNNNTFRWIKIFWHSINRFLCLAVSVFWVVCSRRSSLRYARWTEDSLLWWGLRSRQTDGGWIRASLSAIRVSCVRQSGSRGVTRSHLRSLFYNLNICQILNYFSLVQFKRKLKTPSLCGLRWQAGNLSVIFQRKLPLAHFLAMTRRGGLHNADSVCEPWCLFRTRGDNIRGGIWCTLCGSSPSQN